MKRIAWAALGVAALFVVVGLGQGCQSAGGAAPRAAAAAASEESFDLSTLKVVAYMGLALGGGADERAVDIFEPQLARDLAGIRPPFVLLPAGEVAARAQGQGLSSELREIGDFWRDQQKVDKVKLQTFCEALGFDGILVASVSDWMQVEAAPNSDEPSYTKISAQLAVYDAESGRRVWRTRAARTAEATQFQGDETATARENPMGTGFVGGLRTGSDAPAYEEVSAEVVAELVKALAR